MYMYNHIMFISIRYIIILFLFYHYRTDVLKRYLGKELKLTLPDNKKLTDINWLAIYDLSKNVRSFVSYFN